MQEQWAQQSFLLLAGGILTGKYINEIPGDTRLANMEGLTKALYNPKYLDPQIKGKKDQALRKLKEMAENEFQTTLPTLVLAWTIFSKDVSTAIVGALKSKCFYLKLSSLHS